MINDLLACFIFVLKMESGLDLNGLKKDSEKINYPQWIMVLEVYGWRHAMKMHESDRSALFPLNLTLNRINGIVTHRKEHFEANNELAEQVRNALELPSTIDLQISALATSNMFINWNEIPEDEKMMRYKSLWVGFSGTLWKDLAKKRQLNEGS